jgi:serine/threonine protein kinase
MQDDREPMTQESANPVIADRYEVVRTLGRGSFGHTFLARDRAEERYVAIKMLDVRLAPDWKAFDLFEREAAVLRSLRHHGIPQIFDSFRSAWKEGEAAFLVMEYVEGTSLDAIIADGQDRDHTEIRRLLLDLLGILEYLHDRTPPILHRDIKPANIIVRENGNPSLVDFGAVRNIFAGPDDGGSTVVGTFGYMPYEQYMGQATPSSDLYALAATLLHLVTGRPPREFMTDGGRIEVPQTLPDARLRPVLARMLLPSPSERFASARDARLALLTDSAVATRSAATPALADLGPAPRSLEGEARAAYDRLSWSGWHMLTGSPDRPLRPHEKMLVGLMCVASFGLAPVIIFGIAASRRRRLRRFLRDGLPAAGRILGVQLAQEDVGQRRTNVTYEFEADGRLQRASDQILATSSVRLVPGEDVRVLYLPDSGYDSIIIA